MALPIIADVVRVAVEGLTSNGTNWANVIHFKKTSGVIDSGSMTTLDTEIMKLYGTSTYTSGTQYIVGWTRGPANVHTRRFTPLDGISPTFIRSTVMTGTSTDPALPPDVSVCISLRTAKRGRSFRGRTFWPGPTEAGSTTVGRLEPTLQTSINAQWLGFMSALVGINWQLVVASYLLAEANPVTEAVADLLFDRQRRRKA